jgi:nucleoside-diphosphate-sugar epimerase
VAEKKEAIGQAYIVGDGESISFKEYFNSIADLVGKAPIRKSIPLPIARGLATMMENTARLTRSRSRPLLTHTAIDMVCTPSQMSIQKIKNELGYRPRFGTKEAMQSLKDSYFLPM